MRGDLAKRPRNRGASFGDTATCDDDFFNAHRQMPAGFGHRMDGGGEEQQGTEEFASRLAWLHADHTTQRLLGDYVKCGASA